MDGVALIGRGVVARFCLTVGCIGLITLGPALAGLAPAADAFATFGTSCSFAALLRVFIAKCRHERPCAASLNNWDEALAMAGLAMLAYHTARMLG